MKKYLFTTILIVVLFSCKEQAEKIPASVLPTDKMVSVMIDVHLLEAAISGKNLTRDSSLLLYSLYEKDLFSKHHISDSTYKESFNFYTSHPDLMNKVYEKVIDSLSLREGQKRL